MHNVASNVAQWGKLMHKHVMQHTLAMPLVVDKDHAKAGTGLLEFQH